MREALAQAWSLAREVATRPLAAYERIAAAPPLAGALAFMALLAGAVGIVAAGIATARTEDPGDVVLAFILGGPVAVFAVYAGAAGVIWLVSRALGSRASFEAVLSAWAGSYLPTAVWFAGMLLAHVIVASGFESSTATDPEAVPGGVTFQVLFLAFSVAAFLWKALLLYLTLRVVGRLDFRRIVAAAAILAPVAVGYWALGLELGWFKVPFI
ncbi:MAG: hypothetical protein C4551_04790 [Bacillota bacterium]|nr:MAG: hypothetical protein C4551_04790 [Bacillota bacterium]